jgi:hypothetical protein
MVNLIILCDDKTTAGFLIQTMNDARPNFAANAAQGRTMMQQRVH